MTHQSVADCMAISMKALAEAGRIQTAAAAPGIGSPTHCTGSSPTGVTAPTHCTGDLSAAAKVLDVSKPHVKVIWVDYISNGQLSKSSNIAPNTGLKSLFKGAMQLPTQP